MSDTAQMVLGAVYVFGPIIGFSLLFVWLRRKFGARIQHKQMLRQREAQVLRQAYDDQLTREVADKWGLDPRRHYRRP